MAAVLWLLSGLYIVQQGERGVELKFGKKNTVTGPGLHWHWPFPIEQVELVGAKGILGQVRRAPAPTEWMANPVRGRWLIDPLLVDGAFQLMILWSQRVRHAPSLPAHLESYEQFAVPSLNAPVQVQCRVVDEGPNRARADIHFFAGDQLMARMGGYECVIDASLAEPFKRNRVGDRSLGEQ